MKLVYTQLDLLTALLALQDLSDNENVYSHDYSYNIKDKITEVKASLIHEVTNIVG